jgi:cyclopropane fatty-acyl-phospholipid synthase-like methyltransferase
MANPLLKLMSDPVVQARILRLQVVLAGLALDFWKDTPFPKKAAPQTPSRVSKEEQKSSDENVPAPKNEEQDRASYWIADRIQIKEKLWGEGNVIPGDAKYIDNLTAPLGLNEESSVLDLSGGLGGLARKLATDFNVYVTCLEPNQALASRGMLKSIAAGKSKHASVSAYDPATFEPAKSGGIIG